MLRTTIILAAGALLGGCAVLDNPVRGVALPDGHAGYSVSCRGFGHTIADCMNRAAEACEGPYRIIDQEGHTRPVAAFQSGNLVGFASAVHRTLIVECGR